MENNECDECDRKECVAIKNELKDLKNNFDQKLQQKIHQSVLANTPRRIRLIMKKSETIARLQKTLLELEDVVERNGLRLDDDLRHSGDLALYYGGFSAGLSKSSSDVDNSVLRRNESSVSLASISQPSSDVVQRFLTDTIGLPQYIGLFQENDITMRVLSLLDSDDLIELGISSFGHRKLILKNLDKLAVMSPKPSERRNSTPQRQLFGELEPTSQLADDQTRVDPLNADRDLALRFEELCKKSRAEGREGLSLDYDSSQYEPPGEC